MNSASSLFLFGGSGGGGGQVDPMRFTLQELARVRGAMWTTRLNLPWGPRPGRDDNILATDFFADYDINDRLRSIARLQRARYTHVVMGPLVDSDGYHGMYPPHDWRGAAFSDFLDLVQFFWDNRFVPIVFGHPDGWSFEQTRDELTPLLKQRRAQRLLRFFVPSGWEPAGYEWSSKTWQCFVKWGRETLPNAVIGVHLQADKDAPAGRDARGDDSNGNDGAWRDVAPYAHIWFIQNGPYTVHPSQDPTLAKNFGDQFRADVPHSIAWHIRGGNAGWPTYSAWGPQPLLLCAGEQTSHAGVWDNLPESASLAWGDLAIAAGADGYLDGGTVDVPPVIR